MNSMNETNIQRSIRMVVSRMTKAVLFRNNVGTGWVGKARQVQDKSGVFIQDARPLHAGLLKGSSDLIGWTVVEITPEMIGRKMAIFTAIETKKSERSRRSPEQMQFIKVAHDSGAIAGFCTTPDDAIQLIKNFTKCQ